MAPAAPAPPGSQQAGSQGLPPDKGADAVTAGPPSGMEPQTVAQTSDPGRESGAGSLAAGQPGGSARSPELALTSRTSQGSEGRRGSGGRRASGGSGSLGAGQAGASELTFGAMLSGKRSASSQGDAPLSKLPPVEDVDAEARVY